MCYLCRKALGRPIRTTAPARAPRGLDAFDGPGDIADDPFNDEQVAGNVFDDEFEEPEGYKHFCEHFRINPGSRCTECTKCNLYQAEDEEAVARRAGEKAEREWRIRQGASGASNPTSAAGFRNVNHDLSTGTDSHSTSRRATASIWDLQLTSLSRPWGYWLSDVWADGRWRLEGQAFADWIVERVIEVEDV